MKKTRSVKSALLLSALSLLLCVSMFVGTTYAWLTDSVSSGNNKIVAGNLNIQLLMYEDSEDQYVDIGSTGESIFGSGSRAQNNNAETLWEPGKTQVAYLAVRNSGTLALRYSVALDVENVSKDLYQVLNYSVVPQATATDDVPSTWNPASGKSVRVGLQSAVGGTSLEPGKTHYFALLIHMDDDAANRYQGGEASFYLTVMATQDTVEQDSYGNSYDANATVKTAEELKAAIAKGGHVTFGADITGGGLVFEANGKPVDIDMAGFSYTFAGDAVGSSGTATNGMQILKGNSVTLRNGTLLVAQEYSSRYAMLIQNYADLSLVNMTLYGDNLDCSTAGLSYALSVNCGTVVIEDTQIFANPKGARAVAFDVYDAQTSYYPAPNVILKGNSSVTGKIETDFIGNGTLALEGNTVIAGCDFSAVALPDLSGLAENCKVTLRNCALDGAALTAASSPAFSLPAGRTLNDCVIFE